MALGKQAKVLSRAQIDGALGYIAKTREPIRNQVIFLLSVKAGLRAKEIASLKWGMLTDPDGRIGKAIHLQDVATKGRAGRVIPLNSDLRDALVRWRERSQQSVHVITTERAANTSPHAIVLMFAKWYRALGLNGLSVPKTQTRTY